MYSTTAFDMLPAQTPSTHFAPFCSKGATSSILAGFILLAFLSTATAADFSGSLKGVSITDAQVTNKPPTAVFTYKQDGGTIIFDASGSSDPDGSITKYKWGFGNGTASEGVTTTYTLTNTANFQVTLTVIDNNNGVALSQQTITSSSTGISDLFTGVDGTLLATHNPAWGNMGATYLVSNVSIASNQARGAVYIFSGARHTTSSSDISQFVAKSYTTTGTQKRPHVRASSTSRGYSFKMGNPSGLNFRNIEIEKDGAYFKECAMPDKICTSDHTLKITASGTSSVTITAYVDGEQMCQAVDSSSPIMSGNPGFSILGDGVPAGNNIDDWQDY